MQYALGFNFRATKEYSSYLEYSYLYNLKLFYTLKSTNPAAIIDSLFVTILSKNLFKTPLITAYNSVEVSAVENISENAIKDSRKVIEDDIIHVSYINSGLSYEKSCYVNTLNLGMFESESESAKRLNSNLDFVKDDCSVSNEFYLNVRNGDVSLSKFKLGSGVFKYYNSSNPTSSLNIYPNSDFGGVDNLDAFYVSSELAYLDKKNVNIDNIFYLYKGYGDAHIISSHVLTKGTYSVNQLFDGIVVDLDNKVLSNTVWDKRVTKDILKLKENLIIDLSKRDGLIKDFNSDVLYSFNEKETSPNKDDWFSKYKADIFDIANVNYSKGGIKINMDDTSVEYDKYSKMSSLRRDVLFDKSFSDASIVCVFNYKIGFKSAAIQKAKSYELKAKYFLLDEEYVGYEKGFGNVNIEDTIYYNKRSKFASEGEEFYYTKNSRESSIDYGHISFDYRKDFSDMETDIQFEKMNQDAREEICENYETSSKNIFTDNYITYLKSDKDAQTTKDHYYTKYSTMQIHNQEEFLSKAKAFASIIDALEYLEKKAKDTKIDISDVSMLKLERFFDVEDGYISIENINHKKDVVIEDIERLKRDDDLRDVFIEFNEKWAYSDFIKPPKVNYNFFDELLLPDTDFNYEVLEDAIFDKELMQPINPIKVIDQNTFVTDTPIVHPLKGTREERVPYVAVNVNTLRHMIEVAQTLWMKKAFKFGALDMKEAMAELIKDLHLYAKYTLDDPHEGSRVVKLIRWYGEACINRYANYRVTVQYEQLKSDFYTGECKIPHEFINGHIDENSYMLTNTNMSEDFKAYFFFNVRVDTNIRFIVNVTKGALRVYIDGEEVDVLGVGTYKKSYYVPPNDTVTTLKFAYAGENNGNVNISNVVIDHGEYEGLIAEYEVVRGSGNKFMNILIEYLKIYEDALDNSQETIKKVLDNNYAITEVFEELYDYLDSHHVGKSKGKRITIKQ